jgi:hypothetical protein
VRIFNHFLFPSSLCLFQKVKEPKTDTNTMRRNPARKKSRQKGDQEPNKEKEISAKTNTKTKGRKEEPERKRTLPKGEVQEERRPKRKGFSPGVFSTNRKKTVGKEYGGSFNDSCKHGGMAVKQKVKDGKPVVCGVWNRCLLCWCYWRVVVLVDVCGVVLVKHRGCVRTAAKKK